LYKVPHARMGILSSEAYPVDPTAYDENSSYNKPFELRGLVIR